MSWKNSWKENKFLVYVLLDCMRQIKSKNPGSHWNHTCALICQQWRLTKIFREKKRRLAKIDPEKLLQLRPWFKMILHGYLREKKMRQSNVIRHLSDWGWIIYFNLCWFLNNLLLLIFPAYLLDKVTKNNVWYYFGIFNILFDKYLTALVCFSMKHI